MLSAVDWNEWVAIGTLALAGVTAVTATVAVFQEPIRRWFNRARLSMEIRLSPPDSTQIDLTHALTGAFVAKSLYIRIRVSHENGMAADATEIMVSQLWKRAASGGWDPVPSFLPLNLAWSHFQPRTATMRVPAGLFRHCDLGRFQPDSAGTPIFVFDTIVQPNAVAGGMPPNVLFPGDYRFELMLSSDNSNRIQRSWRLGFAGPWSDDEATMLGRVQIDPT